MKLFLLASALILALVVLGCYRKQASPDVPKTKAVILPSGAIEVFKESYANARPFLSEDSNLIEYSGKVYQIIKYSTDTNWIQLNNQPRESNNLLLLDDSGNVIPKPSPAPDTTKPQYRYFLTHDNPQRYFQALDSAYIISGLIGRAMYYEEALYWLNARVRNFNILYYEGKIDSVKIELPKK